MNIHIQEIGDCEKCATTFTSFLASKAAKNFNLRLTDKPEDCDLLVIIGVLSKTQKKPLLNFWKQMPKDHRILLFGNCGSEKQDLFSFPESSSLVNKAIVIEDLSELLPIDFHIEGCPPEINDLVEFFNQLD